MKYVVKQEFKKNLILEVQDANAERLQKKEESKRDILLLQPLRPTQNLDVCLPDGSHMNSSRDGYFGVCRTCGVKAI